MIEWGDPRYCPLTVRHEPHDYAYAYEHPTRGPTRGRYLCDGVPIWTDWRETTWELLVTDLAVHVGLSRADAARAVDAWRAVNPTWSPDVITQWIFLCVRSDVDAVEVAHAVTHVLEDEHPRARWARALDMLTKRK
jgi:hypothetical protein